MSALSERISPEVEKAASGTISVVDLLDTIIVHAYDAGASDVHFDPQTDTVKLRLRIDGQLTTIHTLPQALYPELLSRVKILSHLRIDEHQAAQDGRFRTTTATDQTVDVRVAIAPSYHGETIVMRLLADHQGHHTLTSLGFSDSAQSTINTVLTRTHGMILLTGPTGSGKTTTLYTFLKQRNTDDVSIVTIEDPIEYAIPDTTQIQTNAEHGLTFATGLRSILRQDPDLIMVGEIRDTETANIAVNAALTGHLLFSTLHTNDAVTALPRLTDMGIEPYLIASTVHLIIGQRLVRRSCDNCKTRMRLTDAERERTASLLPERLHERLTHQSSGEGCQACADSGFQGRTAITEVLLVDEPIREAILSGASTSTLRRTAIEGGMTPMLHDGVEKVINDETTLAEVLRLAHE